MTFWLAAWGIVLALLMVLAAQPVGHQAQLAFALTGLGAMALIRLLRLRGAFDHVFMAIAAAIFFRYLVWRIAETLPSADQPLELAVGLMLLMAEIYAIAMLALNFFVVSDPVVRPDTEPAGEARDWPSVDVLVPSYDEGLDIVGTTLAAARNLDYPADRLRVWLLDDGATDAKRAQADPARARQACERGHAMRAYCDELGVGYLARARNERAKAGNLNAGLAATNGELVVVLDADHAPTPDLLKRTVGHFQADPRLFLVQTPHFFLNADPVERNLALKAMPAESEMFYSVIQRGLDKWKRHLLLRLGRRHAPRGAGRDGRLLGRHGDRGLRDRAPAPPARLALGLCRPRDGGRAAARHVRRLDRPAHALGAGHDADAGAA